MDSIQLEQVYSNYFAKIETNTDRRFIRVTWHNNAGGEDLREVLLHAMQLVLAGDIVYWLCDMRRLRYIEMADQQWLIKELFPLFDAGLRYKFAYVITSSSLELMSSIRIHDEVNQRPELYQQMEPEVFMHVYTAFEWLYSQRG